MKNIGTIFSQHLKVFCYSPLAFLLLVLPIISNCFLMAVGQKEEVTLRPKVGFVSPIFLSQDALDDVKAIGLIALKEELEPFLDLKVLSLKQAQEQLQKGKLEAFLFIEASSFWEALKEGKKMCTLMVNEESFYKGSIELKVQDALQVIGELASDAGTERQFIKDYRAYTLERGRFTQAKEKLKNQLDAQNFGMFVYIFMFTCIFSLNSVVEEREKKVYERICTTPLQKSHYLMGHLLGAFMILFLQILIEAFVFRIMGIEVGLTLFSFIVLSLLFGYIGLAISFFVMAYTPTVGAYTQVATFIVAPLCMISDCLFPMSFLPDGVVKLSYLSPIRWGMMVYRSLLEGEATGRVAYKVLGALVLASCFILLSVGDKIYSYCYLQVKLSIIGRNHKIEQDDSK
ncbi:hypothetical protein CS063_10575 [Sporanaerobium hydrogeniformans]|uniref:Uncharacterized protein n=1 Tax=Sporanaerobium hydrogeniformans TaxID=3072179 RepID=A0AC61DC62_9FIRM|nr:ABC transporter permease [Sporanaerobium hydrogeniformans]PHV70328.1 hypothetical protein CS063_10575 [Sporanaerobium hydrogeniformans]